MPALSPSAAELCAGLLRSQTTAATALCRGQEIPVFLFSGHKSVAQIRQNTKMGRDVSEESLSILDDKVGVDSIKTL